MVVESLPHLTQREEVSWVKVPTLERLQRVPKCLHCEGRGRIDIPGTKPNAGHAYLGQSPKGHARNLLTHLIHQSSPQQDSPQRKQCITFESKNNLISNISHSAQC